MRIGAVCTGLGSGAIVLLAYFSFYDAETL